MSEESKDIVRRYYDNCLSVEDMAEIIVTLRAENAKLKAALTRFADKGNWLYGGESDSGYPDSPDWIGDGVLHYEPWLIAETALQNARSPEPQNE